MVNGRFRSVNLYVPSRETFLSSEVDKLEIELHHAKLCRLRYVEYEYFLDFKDISIDMEA